MFDSLKLFPIDKFVTTDEVGVNAGIAEHLYSLGLLECTYGGTPPAIARQIISRGKPSYRLSALGLCAIKNFDDAVNQKAQEITNKKKERRSAIIWDIVKLFLGSLVALAVEHRYAIIEWLRSLF